MLLFKYFEKRAKDGLPDPNYWSLVFTCLPSDKSIGQPKGIYWFAEYLPSQQHLKGRNVIHTIGKWL